MKQKTATRNRRGTLRPCHTFNLVAFLTDFCDIACDILQFPRPKYHTNHIITVIINITNIITICHLSLLNTRND